MEPRSLATRLVASLALVLAATTPSPATLLLGLAEDQQSLYLIDAATGASTLVGPLGLDAHGTGIAYDSKNDRIYVSDVGDGSGGYGLATLDPATGALTFVGDHGESENTMGMAYVRRADLLYAAELDHGNLVTVSRSTGAITIVGSFGAAISPPIRELAYDEVADRLYGSNGLALYTVDRASGAATLVGAHDESGAFHFNNLIDALGWDPATRQLFGLEWGIGPVGVRNARLWRISPATGAATLVGSTGTGGGGALLFVAEPLFADGFEGGSDLPGGWSSVAP